MKHGKKILKIGRDASHRKATLQSMSAALLEHKRITTTFGKAKALRRFVEPILTHAKDDSTHSRRQAFRKLNDKEAVKTLYNEVAGMIGDRPGGYTRIVKLGQRGGDAAEMAIVELVDFNDVKPEGASGTKRKTRRSRRRGGNNTAPTIQEPAAERLAAEAEPVQDADTPDADTSAADAADQPADAVAEDAPAEAPESQEAEAVASDAADPDATGNPQIPQSGDHPDHGDAEQGAAPGTGEPPPEAQSENQGRSGEHRG